MPNIINETDTNLKVNDFHTGEYLIYIKNILVYLNEYYDIIFNHSYKSDDPENIPIKNKDKPTKKVLDESQSEE